MNQKVQNPRYLYTNSLVYFMLVTFPPNVFILS